MIEISNVSLRLSDEATFAFDCVVAGGESLGIIGPSGAGKSTLLQLVAGFVSPTSGSVRLDGVDHTATLPSARPVSIVFQSNNLFDHLDVATNIGLGINPAFRRGSDAMNQVSEALAAVDLAGFENRRPANLSGGEAQRVALARALVRHRPILLLDEPFAALGPSMREDFVKLLAQVQKERGLTMLTVSHTPDELAALCGRLAFVHEGTIAAVGSAKAMLEQPPHAALARYLGRKVLDE